MWSKSHSLQTFILLPSSTDHHLVHKAILRLNSNEQVEFEISFCSDKPRSVKATVSLQVQDNQYNRTIIEVTGEAYQEIVSLDISSPSQEMTQEDDESGKIKMKSSVVETETISMTGLLGIFYMRY